MIGHSPISPAPVPPLTTLPDGTIKQVNPFSGTEVWTVPSRGHRPVRERPEEIVEVNDANRDTQTDFGIANLLRTTPEKARMVIDDNGDPRILRGLTVSQLEATDPLFRRVANLYEILTYDYWLVNYGHRMDATAARHMAEYLAEPEGRAHVEQLLRIRLAAAGRPASEIDALFTEERAVQSVNELGGPLFGGGHDIILARDHYVPGATRSDQLLGSGEMSWSDHRLYIAFTVDAMDRLYRANPYVRYVAAFQNWLEPAGASIEHLHKQLVAIDEHGLQNETEIAQVRANPNMYNQWAVDYAGHHNLIVAENDHAVAFAGFGHRWPTLEVFSRSGTTEPWLISVEERDAVADLVHACHVAAGPHMPSNEEWLHRPLDVDVPMPWRIMIKWRDSTMAGFEGGTKIFINTLSPADLKAQVLEKLTVARDEGRLAPGIRLGGEIEFQRNSLRYNPAVQG
ncbi:DUF4921 family protein [Corynebacterium sp. AOP12-C2-36]|uniref:DUF4921 family protein n=1 Tax=Corynebacterium sp. AOP12-C2-36 TaxID=3457723 RepID=UPI0040348AB7